MATSAIPVDVLNPGQVFACLGFLEAALVVCGRTRAAFDWRDPTAPRFVLESAGNRPPVEVVLELLASAKVQSVAPLNSSNSTLRWDIETRTIARNDPFPFKDPPSPATLPAELIGEVDTVQHTITIDYWDDRTREDNMKFWGGSAGYPGARLAFDALELVRSGWRDAIADPFAFTAPQSSSFRFDWRRDYISIDAGFSLNSHSGNRFVTMGYPFVELLAAIGMTNARPHQESKLEYHYGIIGTNSDRKEIEMLPVVWHRTALGSTELPFHRRQFCMRLGWPGKEGQSRAITLVIEETRQ